jgi:hypothetical protein
VDTFMRTSGDWAVKSPLTPKSGGDRIGATWVTVRAGHAKDFDAAEPHWVPPFLYAGGVLSVVGDEEPAPHQEVGFMKA